MRRPIIAGSLCLLFACGGTPDGDDGVPADAPPLIGERYALEYGPVTIQPGQEGTRCIRCPGDPNICNLIEDMF